jgi:hypothetical protein
VTGTVLEEYGRAWKGLDPIPDVGEWAVASSKTDAARTLNNMAAAVNKAVKVRQVVELACAIISQLPGRDYPGCLSMIRQYVERHFHFVRDPFRVEMLRTPQYLLHQVQKCGVVFGDCDDAAQMVATLGKCVGFPAEFHAVSFVPGGKRYAHVYTVLYLPNGRPVEFDVTRPQQFRIHPPPITGEMVKRV